MLILQLSHTQAYKTQTGGILQELGFLTSLLVFSLLADERFLWMEYTRRVETWVENVRMWKFLHFK